MVLRERALPLEARRDRRAEELGQLAQAVPRPRVVDPLACVDHRPLGLDENARDLGDGLRVRGRPRGERRPVGKRLGHLLGEDVRGQLDQGGPRAAVPDLGERTAQGVGDRVGHHDLLDPLGHGAVGDDRAEVRGNAAEPPREPRGQHDDGRRVAVGLGDAAEGVLGPGTVLHGEDADPPAGGQPADRVGHVETDALLADDDGADVGPRRRLDDGIDGVADQELDALAFQDLGDGRSALHGSLLVARARATAGRLGAPPRAGTPRMIARAALARGGLAHARLEVPRGRSLAARPSDGGFEEWR